MREVICKMYERYYEYFVRYVICVYIYIYCDFWSLKIWKVCMDIL